MRSFSPAVESIAITIAPVIRPIIAIIPTSMPMKNPAISLSLETLVGIASTGFRLTLVVSIWRLTICRDRSAITSFTLSAAARDSVRVASNRTLTFAECWFSGRSVTSPASTRP